MKTILLTALLLVGAVIPTSVEARTTCTGDEYFVTCEHSEWTPNGYVTCRASGNPNFLSWTCSSY